MIKKLILDHLVKDHDLATAPMPTVEPFVFGSGSPLKKHLNMGGRSEKTMDGRTRTCFQIATQPTLRARAKVNTFPLLLGQTKGEIEEKTNGKLTNCSDA